MTQPANSRSRFVTALAATAVIVAGCGLFAGEPTPTPAGSGRPSLPAAVVTPTPSPTPQLVKSITLVATLGEPKDATPAGMTWAGIQTTAGRIGATASLVEPADRTALASEVDKAAGASLAVVVTVGPDAAPAVAAAATAHPETHFLEVGVVVADGGPANVHGLVFDEAEAGYLAGYIAATFSANGKLGIAGDAAADNSTANYVAGVRAGAAQANPSSIVSVGYAGNPSLPEKGRVAAATLVKGGNSTIAAMPSLAGIGAMRETCTRKARLVTVGTDAWKLVPDVQACLVASVLNRYDTAVGTAIAALSIGAQLPARVVNDVSNDGIAVGEIHATPPAGFAARLAGVMATLKAGPPRPTPAPAAT